MSKTRLVKVWKYTHLPFHRNIWINLSVTMVDDAESPPVGITPPGIRGVVVRIGVIIIFFPQVDLAAQDERIAVVHLAQGPDPFSLNFTRYGNLSSPAEDIRVQIFFEGNQKPSFGGQCLLGFSSPAHGPLKDLKKGCAVLSIYGLDDLSAPDDVLSLKKVRVVKNLSESECWVCFLPELLRNDMSTS
jgi:hypothetical protein